MARAVLADHILFSECMFYLREDFHLQNQIIPVSEGKKTYSFVCTTFHITKDWDLGHFLIRKSDQVNFLSSPKKSLISLVENPIWITSKGFEHPVLFGEVLSCLISFISLQPVKSPRDVRFDGADSLKSMSTDAINDMALTLPFKSAGPGAYNNILTAEKEDEIIKELKDLLFILNNVDKKHYSLSMQAIRLVHLSILVKRDDFGLAYLLLISAIEAIAGSAISRNKVKKHSKEAEWQKIANQEGEFNNEFKELLKAYKDARGSQNYLQKRFTSFILEYCPPKDWEELVVSRYGDYYQEWNDVTQGSKHPSLMETEEIERIFKKAYDERSEFVHQGIQPPHSSPEPFINKFFEVDENYDGHLLKKTLSPSYGLMLAIAKHSITRWLRTKSIK